MIRDSAQFRRGNADDEEWLFQLFRKTMQPYIAAAWGWEELLQREGFVTSLPARGFQVLEYSGARIGSYHVSRQPGHLLLDMILVEPDCQRQGFGSLMMRHLQEQARSLQLPVHLRVLRTNPAVAFHEQCGFSASGGDEHSLDMHWQAQESSN